MKEQTITSERRYEKMTNEITSSNIKPFEYIEGRAWEGANWEGEQDYPFAVGEICAVRMAPYTLNPERLFPVRRDLITYHTENHGGLFPYEILEKIEGQSQSREVGRAMTAWGARRKIAKRVSKLTDLMIGQILMDKYRAGDNQ
jgi:hypothetical protein